MRRGIITVHSPSAGLLGDRLLDPFPVIDSFAPSRDMKVG